jgi:putative restriction endonuclease
MDEKIIGKKFNSLWVWQNKGQRAPHKPLLVIKMLARILQDKERFISYEEADKYLKILFEEYGLFNKKCRTNYPFWRLQNDGIWEVHKKDHFQVNKQGDVSNRDLVQGKAQGGFTLEVYQYLKKNKQLCNKIIEDILDSHFPSSLHEDILESIGLGSGYSFTDKRKRDPNFRDKVLCAYEFKCSICGFDVRLGHVPIALEAAHIKWHQAEGPDVEENGLALCSLHHKLFDRGVFTLSAKCEILVSDRANGTKGFSVWLMDYHGRKLVLPQRKEYYPKDNYVEWHAKEVFQGTIRE